MGFSGGGDRGSMSDINVTPLVDVMLVLLVIFMVTAPLLTQGVEIDLPEPTAAPPPEPTDETVILSVDEQLVYRIGDESYSREELPAALRELGRARPDAPVFLRAEPKVPYRHVAFMLAAAKREGIPRVGLVFDG